MMVGLSVEIILAEHRMLSSIGLKIGASDDEQLLVHCQFAWAVK